MKTNKFIIVGIVAALLLSIVGFFNGGQDGKNGKDGSPGVGAIAGPDIPTTYLHWGAGYGVYQYPVAVGVKTATTTVCAIQSPAATSTLASAGIKLDVASTTATIWSLGVASTAYATTTQIGSDYTVGASAQAFIHASTTPAGGAAEVIAPNQYLVWSETGGITSGDAGTGFIPSGICHATFEEYRSP